MNGPSDQTGEWRYPSRGDRDTRAKIILRVDHQPERYKLSPGLSSLLGMDLETRPRVIAALWQYVKLHELLDADDATTVVLDGRLHALFGDGAGTGTGTGTGTGSGTGAGTGTGTKKLKFIDMVWDGGRGVSRWGIHHVTLAFHTRVRRLYLSEASNTSKSKRMNKRTVGPHLNCVPGTQ